MGAVLSIKIIADASRAQREMGAVESRMAKIGAAARRAVVPAAAALGTLALGAKQAIDAASDLNEEVSKSQQIFGRQAAAVEAFASRAATSLGQSKQQALAATSTFGLIAQGAGLSGQEAAKFSTKFATLASDLASFNNSTPQEAIDAIGAAMRGEAEPIRRFGVMLDDATLRAQALKLGLIDNVKQALTPQQKALSASQAIIAQTTKAQGDFARTSAGAANQQRILAAKSEDLKAKLGKQLLPVYIALQGALLKTADFLSRHQTATKAVIGVVAGLAAAVLAVNAAMIVWNATTKVITTATKVWAGVQWLLNTALLASPLTWIVLAIAAVVAVIVLIATKTRWFQTIWSKGMSAVRSAISAVKNWIAKNWPLLLAILTGPIGLAVLAIAKNWDKIKAGATAVKDWIVDKFTALVGFVRGIPGKISSAASGMFDGIKNAFRLAINWLIEKWNGLSFSLPAIDTKIPGVGKVGGFTLSTPNITPLANGGILNRPTFVAGEAGAEVVAPLDELLAAIGGPTELSDSTIEKLAAVLARLIVQASNGVVSAQARRAVVGVI